LAVPKIADFGLAKRVEVGGGLTATGAVLGTPAYMAPEQANGRAKEIGPAADVYALGAVLYECLTGRPPFQGPTPLDTILRTISEEPVPPRQRRPRVPRDLDTICLKCLEKDPRRRYRSALALADDLRRHLRHEPILARRTGIWERTVKFARRQPLLATLLVFASLGIILGMAQTALFSWNNPLSKINFTAPPQRPPAGANPPRLVVPAAPRPEVIRKVLPASQHRLWCLAFSPDGHALAAADEDGAVFFWPDPFTGAGLVSSVLKGHDDGIRALAFAPDGARLATGGEDRAVKVWDTATRKVRHTLTGHRRRVFAVAFSPDGKALASAGDDEEVRLWDPATGAALRQLREHTDSVYGLAFSPDSRLLASGGHDGTVIIWDAGTGRALHTLRGHAEAVRAVAFSPDGQTVASGGGDGAVRLWGAAAGAEARRLEPPAPARPARINALAFSPGGQLLVVAQANEVRVWDVSARRPMPTEVGSGSQEVISCLAVSPDGKAVAFARRSGQVLLQGPLTNAEVQQPAGP
jgi:hypothetical protein